MITVDLVGCFGASGSSNQKQLPRPTSEFGITESILNEFIEPVRPGHDPATVILDFRGIVGSFVEEHFGIGSHGSERSAHIVGDGIGNVLEFLDHFNKPGGAFPNE